MMLPVFPLCVVSHTGARHEAARPSVAQSHVFILRSKACKWKHLEKVCRKQQLHVRRPLYSLILRSAAFLCSQKAAQSPCCMPMSGFYCGSCKWYLSGGHKVKTIERGHPAAPGEAVYYTVFVCVSIRRRGGLTASLCYGGVWQRLIHRRHLFSDLSWGLELVFGFSQVLFLTPVVPITFLSSAVVVTHCRAGELWRTPGWSARKMTSMSASCACVPSWTTRSALHTCPSGRTFTPPADQVSLLCGSSAHLLVCMLQYGFNMVMSHPHAVNEIALSLNNKSPRWGLKT